MGGGLLRVRGFSTELGKLPLVAQRAKADRGGKRKFAVARPKAVVLLLKHPQNTRSSSCLGTLLAILITQPKK